MRGKGFRLRKSVYNRLLLMTILVIIIFYGVGIYLNTLGIQYVNFDLRRAADAETDFIVQSMELELNALLTSAQELAGDQNLLRFVISNQILSDYQRTEYIKALSNDLMRIRRFGTLTDTIQILLPGINGTISPTDPIFNGLDSRLYNRLVCVPSSSSLQSSVVMYNGSCYLTMQRALSGRAAFLIALGIAPEDALSGIMHMSSDDATQFALLNGDGSIFAATGLAAQLLKGKADSNAFLLYQDSQYILSEKRIPSLRMELRYYKKVSPMLEPLTRHRYWMWILTGMAAMLLASYLVYFRTAVHRPMNAIYEAMGSIEKSSDFSVSKRFNELQVIEERFHVMVKRIEKLAADVYEERFRAQKAELMQLQMQINPHFFYNSLFLIYRMAQKEGNDDVADFSLNLSNYYRYITQSSESEVALRDEVRHVETYLKIQQVRFAPRITVAADQLPEAIADERIPAIILQPLAENAFEHGVRDVTAGGYVEIHYQYTDTWFRIRVADNGGNMNDEQAAMLRDRIRNGELHEGSALYNLNRRLALRYGEKYSLALESIHNGLSVSITFPRKEGKRDDVAADCG